MIKSSVHSDNIENIIDEALMSLDMELEMKTAIFAANLQSSLLEFVGLEKMKHFNVEAGIDSVTISAIDDVGEVLLHGAGPHVIQAGGKPMPIGNGKFARRVSHPGTPSIINEINKAIESAARGVF